MLQVCKECSIPKIITDKEAKSKYHKEYRKTPNGAAACAWNRLTSRAGAQYNHSKSYANIEVRISREDFIAWAVPEYEKWFREHSNLTPSIDRKDSTGHYELGNLQLVEVQSNRRKASKFVNDNAPLGTKWCPKCSRFRNHDEFYKMEKPSAHDPMGLYVRCKECAQQYDREYRERRKAKGNPIIQKRRK
jgi:hypothetical protein